MKQNLPRNPEMSDPDPQANFNPYQPPAEKRLRGYWPRFFKALGRARREYRHGMRESKVGLFRELLVWLFLFWILFVGLRMLGALLYQVAIEIGKKFS